MTFPLPRRQQVRRLWKLSVLNTLAVTTIFMVSVVNLSSFVATLDKKSSSKKASYLKVNRSTLVNSTEHKANTTHAASHLPQNNSKSREGRFAYAFLVTGVDNHPSSPKNKKDPPPPPPHLGFIYNVIVAAHVLHSHGSVHDIVLMVRMATSTDETSLSPEIEDLLHKSGVTIQYIPKSNTDNFYTTIMDKCRVLTLEDYDRVLFMDADLIPLCNIDYIFESSWGERAILRENVIIPGTASPLNAGFFMIQPNRTDYQALMEVVQKVEKTSSFDSNMGWGQRIVPPDHWRLLKKDKKNTRWNFRGVRADQGVLYYYVKYMKRSVSIINDDVVETWGANLDAAGYRYVSTNQEVPPVQLLRSERGILGQGCSPPDRKFHGRLGVHPPNVDVNHFIAGLKPWLPQKEPQKLELMQPINNGDNDKAPEHPSNTGDDSQTLLDPNKAKDTREYWYAVLHRAFDELNYTMPESMKTFRFGLQFQYGESLKGQIRAKLKQGRKKL